MKMLVALFLFCEACCFGQPMTLSDPVFGGQMVSSATPQTYITNGLVAWYKFDDAAGGTAVTTAVDSSTNGHNGTVTFLGGGQWTNGTKGSAIFFGSGTHVAITGVTNPAGAVSISCWCKSSNTNQPSWIMDSATGRIIAGWNATVNGLMGFYSGGWSTLSVPTPANNQWTHICFVASGTTVTLWTNAVVAGTGNYTGTAIGGATMIGTVNSGGSGQNFLGFMDDFRIYNRGLASNEVWSICNDGQ